MRYGKCHCGNVAFRFEAEINQLFRCNCSLCRKRNALMITVPREAFELEKGQETLHLYRWNSGVALHYFCGTCGIYIYHQRRSDPNLLSVNAFCVDSLDPYTLPLRNVDGASRSVSPKG